MLEHFWSLEDELIRLLLPQQFHDLRAQLHTAQELKEEAVVNQDWDTARGLSLCGGAATTTQPIAPARKRSDPVKTRPKAPDNTAHSGVCPRHTVMP